MISAHPHLFRRLFSIATVLAAAGAVWSAHAQGELPNPLRLGAIADTALFENNPGNNLGGLSFVPIGRTVSGRRARGLYRFQLPEALPRHSTIVSATLNLNSVAGAGNPFTYDVHRVLRDWGEGAGAGVQSGVGLGRPALAGEATWQNRQAPANGWTSPGAQAGTDYSATASGSATLSLGLRSITSAMMAEDVRQWLINPPSNFGWMVLNRSDGTESGSARRFGSRQAPTATERPELVIQYIIPVLISNVRLFQNNFVFDFGTKAGKSYAIESRDSLNPGVAWTAVTNIPLQAASGTLTITRPVTGTNRFFRVAEL